MRNKNILILDDDQGRHRAFARALTGNNIVHVETAGDAIRELASRKFDAVFLDHDLGGQIDVPSGPGTGYEVAKWLEEHPDFMPTVVFIHSFNAGGAKNMLAALPNAVWRPGCWTSE